MRNRIGMVLLLALVSGGLAAYLAYTVLRNPANPVAERDPEATVEVAVAARDMGVGTMLTPEDVTMVRWPASAVPAGYPSSQTEVVGRGLITPVRMNEPLLATKLARKEAGGGLPIVLEEGQRALSVKVDEVIAVAGFVQPGTRVDVLVTLDGVGNIDEPLTQLVLQDIEVLTAGQVYQPNPDGEPTPVTVATLKVTPEQAEKLVLASQKGRIQLGLRNTLDRDSVTTEGARIATLLPRRAVATGPRRAPVSNTVNVEIYRGSQQTTQSVRRGDNGGGGN